MTEENIKHLSQWWRAAEGFISSEGDGPCEALVGESKSVCVSVRAHTSVQEAVIRPVSGTRHCQLGQVIISWFISTINDDLWFKMGSISNSLFFWNRENPHHAPPPPPTLTKPTPLLVAGILWTLSTLQQTETRNLMPSITFFFYLICLWTQVTNLNLVSLLPVHHLTESSQFASLSIHIDSR